MNRKRSIVGYHSDFEAEGHFGAVTMNLDTKVIVAPFVVHTMSVEDFDHEAWDNCVSIPITHYWSGEKAPESRHALVKACWTDESLNVRFECRQEEPPIVTPLPILDRKTLGLWDRDVCEVFVAPDRSEPGRYFEFEAAPTGEWIDLGLIVTETGRTTDWEYASGMSNAARLVEERLHVIIQIPWSEVLPLPQAGFEWKANFFRCVGLHPTERYLAWLPTRTTEPNFHVPEAFGTLRFE